MRLLSWRNGLVLAGGQQRGDFLACPCRGEFERLVDVDIPLGDASGGVAEECCDRRSEKPRSPATLPKVWRSVWGVTPSIFAVAHSRARQLFAAVKWPSPTSDGKT